MVVKLVFAFCIQHIPLNDETWTLLNLLEWIFRSNSFQSCLNEYRLYDNICRRHELFPFVYEHIHETRVTFLETSSLSFSMTKLPKNSIKLERSHSNIQSQTPCLEAAQPPPNIQRYF